MLELTHQIQIYESRAKNITDWHTEPWMGMVRVSFGLYNSKKDVDHFINALNDIVTNQDSYNAQYTVNAHGDYDHKTFEFSCNEYFSLSENVLNELGL